MSNINYSSINENFPVAGQDNDTQVFRDNFDSIKTALSTARSEITDLQDNVARVDQANDFNGNTIQNSKFINNTEIVNPVQTFDSGLSTYTIDFQNGNYQIFSIAANTFTFDFLNFPQAGTAFGKVTIELYSTDGVSKTINFSLSGSGAGSIKKSSGFPGTLTVSSTTNPIIIEIWRHSEGNFFMNYLGAFA